MKKKTRNLSEWTIVSVLSYRDKIKLKMLLCYLCSNAFAGSELMSVNYMTLVMILYIYNGDDKIINVTEKIIISLNIKNTHKKNIFGTFATTAKKRMDFLAWDKHFNTNIHGQNQNIWLFPVTSNTNIQDAEPASTRFAHEWGRYLSFENFPASSHVFPNRLAAAGFYYTGVSDEVCCFVCNVTHKNWKTGDSAWDIHKNDSPSCKFINGEDTGNIPIHNERRANNYEIIHPSAVRTTPQPAALGIPINATAHPSDLKASQMKKNVILNHMAADNCMITKILNNDKFKEFAKRLLTYSTWPCKEIQDPRHLAAAGFVYTGEDDRACCFVCGVELLKWQVLDDPWDEHQRFSPDCRYLGESEHKKLYGQNNPRGLRGNRLSPDTSGTTTTAARTDSSTSEQTENFSLGLYCDYLTKNFISIDRFGYEKAQWELTYNQDIDRLQLKLEEKCKEVGDLKDELEDLKDEQSCQVCLQNDKCIAFVPCGHMCCEECASKFDQCHVCRGIIDKRLKCFK